MWWQTPWWGAHAGSRIISCCVEGSSALLGLDVLRVVDHLEVALPVVQVGVGVGDEGVGVGHGVD